MPGRANVIAGQTGIFRTQGRTAEQMKIRFPAGMLVNLGEVPKTSYPGKLPGTRMGTANLIRNALGLAQTYAQKKAASKEPAATNLKHEAMELVLKKKIPIILAGHRADDLITGLRIAKEFKLRAMLTLATEGYLIPDAIQAAKVPVIVHPTMQRASSPETFNGHLGTPAFLVERKIPTAICTAFEGYVPKTRAAARSGDGDGQRPGARWSGSGASPSTPPRCSVSTINTEVSPSARSRTSSYTTATRSSIRRT